MLWRWRAVVGALRRAIALLGVLRSALVVSLVGHCCVVCPEMKMGSFSGSQNSLVSSLFVDICRSLVSSRKEKR